MERRENETMGLKISRELVNNVQFCVLQHVKDMMDGVGHSELIADWVQGQHKQNGESLRAKIGERLCQVMEEYNLSEEELQKKDDILADVVKNIYDKVFADLVEQKLNETQTGTGESDQVA